MSARETFDSSEYHAALKAHDGIHCIECGAVLTPREQRKPKPHPRSVLARCCNAACENAFIKRTIRDWSKIREEVFCRDNYTCQDCGPRKRIKLKFVRKSNMRLTWVNMKSSEFKVWWRFEGRYEEDIIDDLEVHHIIPISEGGPEFDLENLITLCFDCHHLGRHGSKAPTPEDLERERLSFIQARHMSFDWFDEPHP